ncbi:hypothetical protein I871_00020 [Borrelia miyamotoi LB-2001]|nr:hypothetical protein I871_00020 [Borrelia miyamotoi LB-2001]
MMNIIGKDKDLLVLMRKFRGGRLTLNLKIH